MFSSTQTIQELLEYNHQLALVLKRFKTSYWHEKQSLESFCKTQKFNIDFCIQILQLFDNPASFVASVFRSFSIPTILDYLKRTHEFYLNERLFEIEQSIEQILQEKQESNPMLLGFKAYFRLYRHKLFEHIQIEEKLLFPFIENLYFCQNPRKATLDIPYSHNFSLDQFAALHNDEIEQSLSYIREKIILHNPHTAFSFSYKILINQLESFEKDLHIHSLIEDYVLLPKAAFLEQIRKN